MSAKPIKKPSADQIAIAIIALIDAARKEQGGPSSDGGDERKIEAFQAVGEYLNQVVQSKIHEDTAEIKPGEHVHIRRSGALYREAVVISYEEHPDDSAPKSLPAKVFRVILEGIH